MIKKIPANWKTLVSKLYLLRPIHTQGDYNRCLHIVDMLAGRTDLNKDQKDYLESLTVLVEAYEEEHETISDSGDAVDVLKFLLEENDLTGSDLGRILGQRQLGSKILGRKRELSKAHIIKLASHFAVNPVVFLQ
jgi:HTH-type transcriptional regulator / antitoxin HigA